MHIFFRPLQLIAVTARDGFEIGQLSIGRNVYFIHAGAINLSIAAN